MEHSTIDLLSLPQEVHEAILNEVKVADLLNFSLVAKESRRILTNQRIWKTVYLSEFDPEFVNEENWLQFATRQATIHANIRKGRVVATGLVMFVVDKLKGQMYTKKAFVKDDNRILVSWLRTINWSLRNSSEVEEINDHAAVIDINKRQEENALGLYNQDVVLIGDRFAGHYRNPGNSTRQYSLVSPTAFNAAALQQPLPVENIKSVVSNADPAMLHLVVLVDETAALHVFDLTGHAVVKSYAVNNLFKDRTLLYPHDVLFRGHVIYALDSTCTVHAFDIRRDSLEAVTTQLTVPSAEDAYRLIGAHKSLLLGSLSSRRANNTIIWAWDSDTQQWKTYRFSNDWVYVDTMTVHCGLLVATTSSAAYFFDYRAHATELVFVSALQYGMTYSPQIVPMNNGKLLLTTDGFGTVLLDFEHTRDKCEILFVEKISKQQQSTPVTIQACELVSRARELLGTHDFVSRYFKMTDTQRFGIIFARKDEPNSPTKPIASLMQKATGLITRTKESVKEFLETTFKGSKQLDLANMEELTENKLEYCSPYFYHNMVLDASQLEPSLINWHRLQSVKEFFGSAIIFFEEWTGDRWKLSKPDHWITQHT